MTEINISKLIEKTQELVHSGYMEKAAIGRVAVQVIEDETTGNKFKLEVSLTLIPKSGPEESQKK